MPKATGTNNGAAKLNWNIVDELRRRFAKDPYFHAHKWAKEFEVSTATISNIVRGKTWKEENRPPGSE